jgi:ribulose-5-phosphate 4-epimerase/fuculose-1-phosphate aldolase
MGYEEERIRLLGVIEDCLRWSLLDCGGGALSVRVPDGNILMTTTGSAFKRWHVGREDFIVLSPEGEIREQTGGLGASGTPIHLALYAEFPACHAVLHGHAPYATTFASLGMSVPSLTNQLDMLGDVPCLIADDSAVKTAVREGALTVAMPQGMVQRPDVAAVNILHLVPQLVARFADRGDELGSHGLAFTVFRHGAFAFARSIDEAFDNLFRVESSARLAVHAGAVRAAGAACGEHRVASDISVPRVVS